jgi:hypothetical protein
MKDNHPIPGKFYERMEDMSSDGTFCVFRENDGDIILQIIQTQDTMTMRRFDEPVIAEVQFCTCSNGGGKSPRVLEALYELARAIQEDNANCPFKAGPKSKIGA